MMQVIIDVSTIIGLVIASMMITAATYLYHRAKKEKVGRLSLEFIQCSWRFTFNITLFFLVLYTIRSI